MTPPKPSRRRLTQAKAAGYVEDHIMQGWADPPPLRTRTGRRRSWWQRGWKR